jgi:hypothetical protein
MGCGEDLARTDENAGAELTLVRIVGGSVSADDGHDAGDRVARGLASLATGRPDSDSQQDREDCQGGAHRAAP